MSDLYSCHERTLYFVRMRKTVFLDKKTEKCIRIFLCPSLLLYRVNAVAHPEQEKSPFGSMV